MTTTKLATEVEAALRILNPDRKALDGKCTKYQASPDRDLTAEENAISIPPAA